MIETLYYMGFCFTVIILIIISLKYDDHEDFFSEKLKKQHKHNVLITISMNFGITQMYG